jgi:hypothetical protein
MFNYSYDLARRVHHEYARPRFSAPVRAHRVCIPCEKSNVTVFLDIGLRNIASNARGFFDSPLIRAPLSCERFQL